MQSRIVRPIVLCAALLLAPLPSGAQDFDAARKDIDKRLKSSLDELGRTRSRIAKEQIPLSRTVSQLENEVVTLRRERDQLLKLRDSRTIDLTSLRKQVENLRGQEEFIEGRLSEFVRDFESRLDISELPLYEERTAAARLSKKNANLDAGQKRGTQLEVVRARNA